MANVEIKGFKLIGLDLHKKTRNENEQSMLDCGGLWHKFETEKYFDKIINKLSDEIYAVYYNYDGDYTQDFGYFIGCKVAADSLVPDGLDSVTIPDNKYRQFNAKGTIPNCIGVTWNEIWNSDTNRDYKFDFEVYDERSKDWQNGEVDIFISVK